MKQRDVVLVPFPFYDLSASKVRPALILSNDDYNKGQDVILCGITSNLRRAACSVPLNPADARGLRHKSMIRVDTIHKLSKERIIKRIARVAPHTFSLVREMLHSIIA